MRVIDEAFGNRQIKLTIISKLVHQSLSRRNYDVAKDHANNNMESNDQEQESVNGHYVVLFGFFCGLMNFTSLMTVRLYYRIFIRDLVNAAARLSAIGPLEGAKIQVELIDELERFSQYICSKSLEDLTPKQSNPFLEMIQARHDLLYSRLFNS